DDRIVVDVLLKASREGRGSDNSFKQTVYAEAATQLNQVITKGGYKTAAKVQDRWQVVRTQFHRPIDSLLKMSGAGWDPVNNCVTADDDTWRRVAAAPMRGVSWDLFGDVSEIVNGKTATGQDVLD
ncbi:hypothetical protein HD553DRAFT_258492, partial [Filobasidium floriforme]|uniref:uncharacterized protein n=1 Tax=Filobasidium floriforme TaxID=5210 RepID=UPI001E8CA4DA